MLNESALSSRFKGVPYLGQVATRCYLPDAVSLINKQIMARMRHRARDLIVNPVLVFPNWYLADFTGNTFGKELAVPGTATITAAIEYPVGNFTQVKFGGSTSSTVASGGMLTSDPCPITIPDGEFFFVRTFYTNASGVPSHGYFNISTSYDGFHSEALTYAALGLSDQTMGGTVIDSGSTGGGSINGGGYTYGPCAILSQTTKPSFLLIGDSRCEGQYDSYNGDATGNVGEIARSVGQAYAYINCGRGNGSAAQMVATHTNRVLLAAYVSHVISEFGGADLRAGASAATVLGNLQTIWGYFTGKFVYQSTITPFTTSTDSWATTVNQTQATGSGPRITLNDAVRGLTSGIAACLEVADQAESARNSGLWKAPGYTADGIHATQLGYTAIRDSHTISTHQFVR